MSDAVAAPPVGAPITTETRAQAFRPVTDAGEARSGELLLVEAYVVIWALTMWFVWRSWKRIAAIEARAARLEERINQASGEQP